MYNIFRYICFVGSFVFLSIYVVVLVFGNTQKNFPEGDNHIAFVLDVSKSMSVVDIGDRSRLSIAKQKILETIVDTAGASFSLNIFAGESLRILPFTSDISIFQTFLLGLGSDNLSKQGTQIDLALNDALLSFGEDKTGSIVMFTDGDEDAIEIPESLKKALEAQEVEIIIVGVGTKEGGFIIDGVDPFGRSVYKQYQGARVLAKLNESGLMKLSKDIGGRYLGYQEDIYLGLELGIEKYFDGGAKIFLLLASFCWIMFLGLSFYPLYRK